MQDGLIVLNAKFDKNRPLVSIFLWDLKDTVRAILDLENKKIVYSPIEISRLDLLCIFERLEQKEPQEQTKKSE